MARYTPNERAAILAQAARARARSATLAQPAAQARIAGRAVCHVAARRRVDWDAGEAGVPNAAAGQHAWDVAPFWLRCWLALDVVRGTDGATARPSPGASLVAALDAVVEALVDAPDLADRVDAATKGPPPDPASPKRTGHFQPPLQRTPR